MLTFYGLAVAFCVLGEIANSVWMYKKGTLKPINTIPTIVFTFVGALCFIGIAEDFFMWLLFAGLVLWHGLGIFLQKDGNPLNQNRISLILFGMYFMVFIVAAILRSPCDDPNCGLHHPRCSIEELQIWR